MKNSTITIERKAKCFTVLFKFLRSRRRRLLTLLNPVKIDRSFPNVLLLLLLSLN